MLYSVGLNGVPAADLHAFVSEVNGVLIDVRLWPGSAPVHHRPSSLTEIFGAHYQQIRSFGNTNLLRSGPPEFLDPAAALDDFRAIRARWPDRTPIILCACWSWRHCHRREVADFLIHHGEDSSVHHLLRRDCSRVGCL